MNGKSSGALSGAASGAAMGTMIVPGWGTAIGAVVGGVVGLMGGSASDAAMKARLEWNEYNAKTRYDIDTVNTLASTAIAKMNADLIQAEAEYRADVIEATVDYDSRMIASTIQYNNLLGEQETELIWESAGLEADQIRMYRERERGQLIATQAASGIVVDRGTYHKVVQDQKMQQALDTFIVYRNAQVGAAQVLDAMAKSTWEGEMQIKRIQWNGALATQQARISAGLQSTTLMESALVKAEMDKISAKQRYDNTVISGTQMESTYKTENTTNMVNGLFSSASKVAPMFINGVNTGESVGVINTEGYSEVRQAWNATPPSMSGGYSNMPAFGMNYNWGA